MVKKLTFKSPLKFAPATIPVTAGKNTAKTEKKFSDVPARKNVFMKV